jgi:hypothetical protein
MSVGAPLRAGEVGALDCSRGYQAIPTSHDREGVLDKSSGCRLRGEAERWSAAPLQLLQTRYDADYVEAGRAHASPLHGQRVAFENSGFSVFTAAPAERVARDVS